MQGAESVGRTAAPFRSRLLLSDALRKVGAGNAIAFAVPLVIFACSLGSEPAAWDTAEMQGVPYILGIAHPTGFPLYTLLGFLFAHAFAFGSIALRMNLFSAICVSTASLLLYRAARELRVPAPCGVVAALWFSVGGVVWTHAIRAEAHDLALALSAACVLFLLRWQLRGMPRDFVWASAMLGLALAAHPLAVWLIPGALLCAVFRSPDRPTALRAVLFCIGGVALYLYLPIRSMTVHAFGVDPTAGLPGIHGGIFWNYNDPSTLPGLAAELTGSQFGAGHTVLSAFAPQTLQRYLWMWLGMANTAYGAFALVLAFIGLARLWRRNWRIALVLLILTLAAVPFSYTYSVESDADRYRLLSLWLLPLLMASAALPLNDERDLAHSVRAAVVFVLTLIWGVETFAFNSSLFSNRFDTGGRALISEASTRVPAGAIVVTPWVDATSLAYGAYTDGTFSGRVIVAGWPDDYAADYRAWLARRRVYVIAEAQPAAAHGVRYAPVGRLDGGHRLWRVLAR